jgi:hypothetical protein
MIMSHHGHPARVSAHEPPKSLETKTEPSKLAAVIVPFDAPRQSMNLKES